MALMKAQEAANAANQFHIEQKKKWFEAMKSFADNELAALIASEANAGKFRTSIKLPEHISFNTLRDYLAEFGYTLEKGDHYTCFVSWQNQ